MLGSSFFDNDPFFAGHHEHMRQMGQMQMFPMGGGFGNMLALPDNRHLRQQQQQQQQQQQRAQNMQVADPGLFMDPFAHFGSMFSNMRSMMTDMNRAFSGVNTVGDPGQGGHVFQQSSFMTYSNSGNNTPKFYQASSSTRRGPDGVMETKRTERDSESGLDKIAVGHHIRDRGHVVERSRNSKTGDLNENQEYVNLDEEEGQQFEQEYTDKWRTAVRGPDHGRRMDRSRPIAGPARVRYAALPEPEHRRHRKASNRKE